MNIELIKGDITKVDTEAIVNAANTSLLGGGGVDGAIHRAGGPAILEECQMIRARQGGCDVGEAVITTAGNMPSSYVIHTVGPVYCSGKKGEAELLHNAYVNSLKLADEKGIKSIAFPNISTGIYGYPKDQAAEIAVEAVKNIELKNVERVVFVCHDDENYALYKKLLG